jgi:hypothetical protein
MSCAWTAKTRSNAPDTGPPIMKKHRCAQRDENVALAPSFIGPNGTPSPRHQWNHPHLCFVCHTGPPASDVRLESMITQTQAWLGYSRGNCDKSGVSHRSYSLRALLASHAKVPYTGIRLLSRKSMGYAWTNFRARQPVSTFTAH